MAVMVRVKSHYSLGFGTASVESLVARAAERGIDTVALTDLESLAGQPEFHEQCRRHGIRPVTGVELRPGHGIKQIGERAGRLVLLARNLEGFRSLCRIVSLRRGGTGSRAAQEAARDVVGALAQSPSGLMALSDDVSVLQRVLEVNSLKPGDLRYLLVRPAPGGPPPAATRARELSVAIVADADVVMLEPADHDLHRLQVAVRTKRRVGDLDVSEVEPPERSLPGPAELAAAFADLPEAVAESERLAGACRLELGRRVPALPGAEAFGGDDPADRLSRRCRDALAAARRNGRCQGPMYEQRLDAELRVIADGGYAGYFLAAAEVADAAAASAIAIAPRGSAVGSLVVHLLGISPLDPVERGLLFERFLHPRRPDPPDIDIDVDSEHREALVHWVRRRFGPRRVAMVGAYHGFRLRAALREGLRAAGAGGAEIQRLSAHLPKDDADPVTPDDLRVPGLGGIARAWMPTVLSLVGKPRLLALHPAGVVIADEELDHRLPLERSSRGLPVTQYDLRAVDRAGFLKLDLLGSKVLSQLAQASRLAGGSAPADPLALPVDDAATLACLDHADTLGCFQVETPAVRSLLEQLPVLRQEDCVAALALVRPGAAAGAAKRDYVAAVHGEPRRGGVHPWLAERLAHTHGVMLYDEDLLAVLAETADLSLSDADVLRTAIIDAGDDGPATRRLERWFLRRAREAAAPEPQARAVWRAARQFAAYSFSRAHAWSYALQAYAAAYWKSHHPEAFGCGLLNGYGGAYPLRTVAADLARHGLNVHPPTVNHSARWTERAEPGAIRVGLAQVKHVTARTVSRLLESRQRDGVFHSMDDFLTRVRPGRRETAALVRVGACDGLPPLTAETFPFVHEALLQGLAGELHPQGFDDRIKAAERQNREDPARRRYQILTRIRNELDHLEMHLCAHPMAVLRADAEEQGCRTVAQAVGLMRGDTLRVAVVLAGSRRHPLRTGALQFLTLEDETGLLEASVAPRRYQRLARRLTTPGPYLVEGVLHEDHGHRYLDVVELAPFHERHQRRPPISTNGRGASAGGRGDEAADTY